MGTMRLTMVAAAALLALAPAASAGDAAKGQKVFNKCKACHEVATEKNKIGPHLKGVFGRTSGTIEGYAYSDDMKAKAIVWSAETLKPYLADPKAVVPAGKMSFAGLRKEDELEDVIAYLMEATK